LCALQISHTIDVLHSETHISIQKELTVKKRNRKEMKRSKTPTLIRCTKEAISCSPTRSVWQQDKLSYGSVIDQKFDN
jgi:hypothetical protein